MNYLQKTGRNLPEVETKEICADERLELIFDIKKRKTSMFEREIPFLFNLSDVSISSGLIPTPDEAITKLVDEDVMKAVRLSETTRLVSMLLRRHPTLDIKQLFSAYVHYETKFMYNNKCDCCAHIWDQVCGCPSSLESDIVTKSKHVPHPIRRVDHYLRSIDYFYRVIDAYDHSNLHCIDVILPLMARHHLLDRYYLLRDVIFVKGPVEICPFMDVSSFIPKIPIRVADETMAGLKDVAQSVKVDVPGIERVAEAISNASIHLPDVTNLADSLNKPFTLNIPALTSFTDTIKGLFDYQKAFDALLLTFTGKIGAFKWISDLVLENETVRDIGILAAFVGIELFRRSTTKISQWWKHALAAICVGMAFKCSKVVQTFVLSYYSTTYLMDLYRYLTSRDDEAEVSACAAHAEFTVSEERKFGKGVMMTIISIVTGISSLITLTSIAKSLSVFQTIVNGGRFVMDTVLDFFVEFCGMLDSKTGYGWFKNVYSKHQQLLNLVDWFRSMDDKLTEQKPILKREIDAFYEKKAELRDYQKRTRPLQGNGTVISMLNLADKIVKTLEINLRVAGYIGEPWKMAPGCTFLIGPPGTCKTTITHIIQDISTKDIYGDEFYELYKQNKKLYTYSIKPGVPFWDSFHNECLHGNWDDFGQTRKATDADKCSYTKFVDCSSNEPYFVNMSQAEKKETVEYGVHWNWVTSNMHTFDNNQTFLSDPEAFWRRAYNMFGCAWRVDVVEECRITADTVPENGDTIITNSESIAKWGYIVNNKTKGLTNFDPSLVVISSWDCRPGSGKASGDYMKFMIDGEPRVKTFTWEEFVPYYVETAKRWRSKEKAKYANMSDLANDPKVNVLLNPDYVRPHMDGPKLASILKGLSTSAREELRQALDYSHLETPVGKIPCFSEFEGNLDAFIDAFMDHMVKAAASYNATNNTSNFANHIAATLWGRLMGKRWASYYARDGGALCAYMGDGIQEISKGFISAAAAHSVVSNLTAYGTYSTLKVQILNVIDLFTTLAELSEVWAVTLDSVISILTASELNWWDASKQSVSMISKTCKFTAMVMVKEAFNEWNMLTTFRNLPLDIIVGALSGVIFGVSMLPDVVEEIAPFAEDYEQARHIKNPLKAKCRTTKKERITCPCKPCKEWLKEYAEVRAKSDENLVCELPNIVLADPHVDSNDRDLAKSVYTRNVFNLSFYTGDEMVPIGAKKMLYPKPETRISSINMLVVNDCLSFTMDHAIFKLISEPMAKAFPHMMVVIRDHKGARDSVKSMSDMKWILQPEIDRAWWFNDPKGMRDWGGGIKGIEHNFISEKDLPPRFAKMFRMKYDHAVDRVVITEDERSFPVTRNYVAYSTSVDLGEGKSMSKENLIDVAAGVIKPGQIVENTKFYAHRSAFAINVATEPGMCGVPLITNDSSHPSPKIFAVLCGGSKNTSYACGITREQIDEVMLMCNAKAFDTSLLPYSIVEYNGINPKFNVLEVRQDTHTMADKSSITRTAFAPVLKELTDRIPTYLGPVVKKGEDGLYVEDGLNITRDKYLTHSAYYNKPILRMAAVKLGQMMDQAAGPGKRAYILTGLEAANGAMGEQAMSTSTSPGGYWILKGVTKSMIVKRLDESTLDFSSPDGQEFLRKLEESIANRKNRRISVSFINEFPKDEVLPKDKVNEGKARCVCGVDGHEILADKCYMSCFMQVAKQVALTIGILIGYNVYDEDHMRALMLKIFNRIYDLDVSAWDTIITQMLLEAFKIVVRIVLHDATQEHLDAIDTCIEQYYHYIHLAHIRKVVPKTFASAKAPWCRNPVESMMQAYEWLVKDLVMYLWNHGMLSGSYLTLGMNTTINSIITLYFYMCVFVEKTYNIPFYKWLPSMGLEIPIDWIVQNHTKFMTGDDVEASISRELTFLSVGALVTMYANHGIKATTASKGSAADSEFTTITRDGKESASAFCKRKIRWCAEKGRYVSCLSLDSLACMLMYTDNNLREYKEVLDNWYKEMSRRGRADFEKYAPPITRIASEKYNYISIYSDYDIALMATVDGVSNTICRKVFAALENSELSRDELLSLEEWRSSDRPYELKLPVGVSPHSDEVHIRMTTTENRSSYSVTHVNSKEFANSEVLTKTWTARKTLCLNLKAEIKAIYDMAPFMSEGEMEPELKWRLKFLLKEPDFVTYATQMAWCHDIDLSDDLELPIGCDAHSDENPLIQKFFELRNASNVTLNRLCQAWAANHSIQLLARNNINNSETMAESKHCEQVSTTVHRLIEEIIMIEPFMDLANQVDVEVHETTSFTTDGVIKETHPSDIPKPLNYRGDQSDIKSWLGRPFLVANINWTNVAANSQLITGGFSVAGLLNSITPWKNKLSGFNLWRGTAVITLQINASPFQAGKLLLHYMPVYKAELDALNITLMQKTMHPNVELDCRDTEVQLRIPYIAPTSYLDSLSNFDWGYFYVDVLAPLRYGTAAPTNVPVSIWMHFEDFEVAAPIPIIAYSDEARAQPRHISKTLKTIGKVAGTLSSAPGLGPVMGMTALAADVASKAAYTLGYSKPLLEEIPTPVIQQANRYSATSDGVDTSIPLSISAQNKIQQMPMSVRTEDEMSVSFLSQVQSYWQSVAWNNAQSAGVNLLTLPICPRLFTADGSFSVGAHTVTCRTQHPVAMLADLTTMWRGSFEITIKVVKTQFHTGRLDFQFTTNSFGGDSFQDIGVMREILDISVSDEITIKLPYLVGQNFLDQNSNSGSFRIKVLNSLRAPETVSDTVELMIFVRAGKDFEVQGVIPTGGGYPVVVTPHSDEKLPTTVIGAQDDEDLGVSYSSLSLGEQVTSLNQLIKRYNVVCRKSTTLASQYGMTVWPWSFGSFTIDGAGAKASGDYGGDVLSRIAPCYRFFKGSMNVGIVPDVINLSGTYKPSSIRRALFPYTAYNSSNIAVSTTAGDLFGAVDFTASQPKSTNIGFNLDSAETGNYFSKVPFFSDMSFSLVTPSVTNVPDVSGGQPLTSVAVAYLMPASTNWTYYRAAGDDFRFGFFIATPPLYVSST